MREREKGFCKRANLALLQVRSQIFEKRAAQVGRVQDERNLLEDVFKNKAICPHPSKREETPELEIGLPLQSNIIFLKHRHKLV